MVVFSARDISDISARQIMLKLESFTKDPIKKNRASFHSIQRLSCFSKLSSHASSMTVLTIVKPQIIVRAVPVFRKATRTKTKSNQILRSIHLPFTFLGLIQSEGSVAIGLMHMSMETLAPFQK